MQALVYVRIHTHTHWRLFHERKMLCPILYLSFVFHIPGFRKSDLWIFLFWTGLSFFKSQTPYHFIYISVRMAISNSTINHLKEPSLVPVALQVSEKGKNQRAVMGLWVLSLPCWKHECLPVCEIILHCPLQGGKCHTKVEFSGSFHLIRKKWNHCLC